MALTELQCKKAKAKDKTYRLADEKSLYLEIAPNGSKYWRMKYHYAGKEKRLAIGVYPETSLTQARKACLDARELIKQGIDPTQAKRALKAKNQEKSENTFEAMFKVWYETKKDGWSPLYAKTQRELAEKDILPSLGFRPIADIRTPEIIACLKKIESRGALNIMRKCNQIVGKVFDYAIALGKTDINPAKSTQVALKTAKTKHQKCMPTEDVPSFLYALENNIGNLEPQTINAIRFIMMTFVRTKEMTEATWNEIDFEKSEWRITAKQVNDMFEHTKYTYDENIRLNKFLTIHLSEFHDTSPQKLITTIMDNTRKWLKRNGKPHAHIWVIENGKTKGIHMHALIHIPPHFLREYRKKLNKWLPFETSEKTVKIDHINYPAWGGLHENTHVYRVLRYMCKGLNPQTPSPHIPPSKQRYQGKVIGRRCGHSTITHEQE